MQPLRLVFSGKCLAVLMPRNIIIGAGSQPPLELLRVGQKRGWPGVRNPAPSQRILSQVMRQALGQRFTAIPTADSLAPSLRHSDLWEWFDYRPPGCFRARYLAE